MVVGAFFPTSVMFGWRIWGKEGAEIINANLETGMQEEELRRTTLPKQNPRLETKALHLTNYLAFP